MASLAREVKANLGDYDEMWDLAQAATSALTVDEGIGTVQKLYDLSKDLGRVPMSDMSFLTIPVIDNPEEPANAKATVVVDEPRAEPIFEMLQQDVSMTGGGRGPGGNGGGGSGSLSGIFSPSTSS
jgi:hypothetical protein